MNRSSRAVAIWVGIGVLMLLIQVVLGGITRLTGSGLSITEWNVITGTLPPFQEQDWLNEFDKYRQTPQYRLLNVDFTLSDFKFIYFWEWLHRFWARLIGIVFVVGFLLLWWKKKIRREMVPTLLTLFLLGALQGAVGWIMVASGLTGDAVYVKPTRLAMHFLFAVILIAYAWWFFLVLIIPATERTSNVKGRSLLQWLLVITGVQLMFGALMAGHRAATAAPTWPDINGDIFPSSLFEKMPVLINFIENKITVHFVHRNLAYLILVLTIVLTIRFYQSKEVKGYFNKLKWLPLSLVFVQVLLGIFTLITSRAIAVNQWNEFEWMAQLHQVTGLLFTLSLVLMLFLVRKKA